MGRRLQAGLGLALAGVGLTGLVTLGPRMAAAEEIGPGESHATMHRMMDSMHGPGTADRMHEVEGAEQMMNRCSKMMDSMDEMDERMGGGMMGSG